MIFTEKNVTVGDIVAELPHAAKVFKKFGIDYCCGGRRLLDDVIKELSIDREELLNSLKQLENERISSYNNSGNNFNEMNPSSLSAYIEDTHHKYLRSALPEINEILATVLRAHGNNHKELFEVYSLFGRLKTELEIHLLKEELNLFPAFSGDSVSAENKKAITELSKEIVSEHETAGEILSRLRSITNNYSVPDDACATFSKAYSMLEELENDLHQHIHLENNILLKEYVNSIH